jgi:hypothetical protein
LDTLRQISISRAEVSTADLSAVLAAVLAPKLTLTGFASVVAKAARVATKVAVGVGDNSSFSA